MVKTFKNLQLQNLLTDGLETNMKHLVLEYYKDCSNDDLVLTLTYFSFLVIH